MIRRRRTPSAACVGVTGGGGGLGRALLVRLARRTDLDCVAGLDGTPGPLLVERLHGFSTVVHLSLCYDAAVEPRARRLLNVRGTAALLEAARLAGVDRVVLVTGVEVYGAGPGTAVPLPEDAPLRAQPDNSLTGDLVEVERLADHATRTGLDIVVLRPASMVGGALGPAYDGAQLLSLAGARLLAVRGVEPLWQLCHTDDLLTALELAAVGQVRGAVAVGCDGWLSQREVEHLASRRRLELPAAFALSTAERLHRIGATTGSPQELHRLLYPLVVEPRRLHAAGWTPAWTNSAALTAHLAGRPPGTGRAGSYTTAGATVAMVGTAALVRKARQRRR